MTAPPPDTNGDGDGGPAFDPPADSARPGLTTFTIEGRAAPALFVVGWVATILGLGSVLAGGLFASSPVVLVVGLVLLSIGLVAAAGSQGIERRAAGTAGYSGPSPLLVFVATIPVAYLAAVAIGSVLDAVGVSAPRPVGDLMIVAIQGAVTVGIVALVVVGTGGLSWRQMGLRARPAAALADLAWGAVFAGPVIAVTVVATAVLVTVFGVAPESPLPPTGEASGLVLHLIAGAVIAPLAEEILFRGVATTAWVGTYGLRSGILRAAVFFALAHVLLLGGADLGEAVAVAIVGFAGRLPVAIALGWVYVRRRSLWAAVGLHAAFNAILLVLAHVAVQAGPVG